MGVLSPQERKVFEITDNSKTGKFQSIENPVFSGSQQLFDSEVGLTRYSTDIVTKFYKLMNLESLIIQNKGNLLEFGAGTGFLAQLFVENFGIRPECVELDPVLAKLNIDRGFKCFRFLKDTKQKYDAIYTSNVLEHIEDDRLALSNLHSSLVSGGLISIYVPAHAYLFTQMDLQVGHVRRYSRSELKRKVLEAGFEIKMLNYNDSLGFFATLLVKAMGYRGKANLGSTNSLLFYDKYLFPVSRFLDRAGFRFLVGKNLILVARKP